MVKPRKSQDEKELEKLAKSQADKIELDPDAWPRFEQFVRSLAKSPPKHRVAKPDTKANKASNRSPAKGKLRPKLSGKYLGGSAVLPQPKRSRTTS